RVRRLLLGAAAVREHCDRRRRSDRQLRDPLQRPDPHLRRRPRLDTRRGCGRRRADRAPHRPAALAPPDEQRTARGRMIRVATITLVAAVALAAAGCGGSCTTTAATLPQPL